MKPSVEDKKLLGSLSFVSRTFEGRFGENPYVLDMDANLYIGPADHMSRDEHSGIEVIYQFLKQTEKIEHPLRDLLRNRLYLLDAFSVFDQARAEGESDEFQSFIFGTYDGEPLRMLEILDETSGLWNHSQNRKHTRNSHKPSARHLLITGKSGSRVCLIL